MRKALLSAALACSAVLAAPAAALAGTDYLTFSNQTAEQWTLVSYSVSAGTFTAGGNTANGGAYQYSTIAVTGAVNYTVVWRAQDGTTCTFTGGGYQNQYGNWQPTISSSLTNQGTHNYQCKTTPIGSGSYYFSLKYGVSY